MCTFENSLLPCFFYAGFSECITKFLRAFTLHNFVSIGSPPPSAQPKRKGPELAHTGPHCDVNSQSTSPNHCAVTANLTTAKKATERATGSTETPKWKKQGQKTRPLQKRNERPNVFFATPSVSKIQPISANLAKLCEKACRATISQLHGGPNWTLRAARGRVGEFLAPFAWRLPRGMDAKNWPCGACGAPVVQLLFRD